jgi:hypothetical protein
MAAKEEPMPSPFPGMDPYLESRALWRSFHTQLIVEICRQLQPQLVPSYVARPEERVVLGPVDQPIVPDVVVREREHTGAVAVVPRAATQDVTVPEEIVVPDLTVPHRYVAIRDARSHEVITVIEVLSPWNKSGQGREEYREKQRAVLLSDTHLVEIDLLRAGRHTVAVPEALAGSADYRVCLHQARRDRFELIRFGVREPLPRVRIPLRTPAEAVVLDLGAAVTRVYEDGAYGYEIDYSVPPEPPLRPEDAGWTTGILASRRSGG